MGGWRGGLWPLQRWPNSLQRKLVGGTQRRVEGRVLLGVEQVRSRRRRAIVFVRHHHDEQERFGPQEPLVLGGGGPAVGAQGARGGGERVLEAAARFAERRDARDRVFDLAGVVLHAADVRDVRRAGFEATGAAACRAARTGRRRSCRRSRRSPAIEPSPAPMSVLTTARCRSARPRRVFQALHQDREVHDQIPLKLGGLGRIVDHEQDIHVARRDIDVERARCCTRSRAAARRPAHARASPVTRVAFMTIECRRPSKSRSRKCVESRGERP